MKYCDKTTQKEETIEFYNYYDHLKNFGFTWEQSPLELKYEITLSSDEKTSTKKITMGKTRRPKLVIGESRILFVTVSVSSEYFSSSIQYFKVRDGEIKDLRNTIGLEREKFRRDFNERATDKYLYSTTNITSDTIIMAMGDYKVAYLIKK